MIQRIVRNWVYGGFLAGFLLLGLVMVFGQFCSLSLVLVFLQLPIYMLHQFEEHDDDRFRRFVNSKLGGGREILSESAVFVINVPGVWGVNLLSFILAYRLDLGFGLIAVYLTLVNALVHLVQGLRMGCYNPGLISALLLFFPLGGYALWIMSANQTVSSGFHLIGILIAIVIHIVIVINVSRNLKRLPPVS